MTIDLDNTNRWEPDRDRWGRPLIVSPGGGKPVGYTRATTVAKTLDDEGSLIKWAQRMTAAGLVRRPDLLALLSSKLGPDGDIPEAHKNDIQRICDEAKEHGGGSRAANMGTALHALTEQIDGGQAAHIPSDMQADIDAYRRAVEPFEVLGIEEFVVLDDHKIGGTFDRLWRLPDGTVAIADLKTGQNLDYSWRSISVQLAIYANSLRYRDGLRSPLWIDGKVDTDTAIVIHLPVGRGECNLYQVDIRKGWIALQHSMWARDWRSRRDLHTPLSVPAKAPLRAAAAPAPTHAARASTETFTAEGAVPARRTLLVERVTRLLEHPQGNQTLRLLWPDGVPTFKKADTHTDTQLDAIEAAVQRAEADLVIPFGVTPAAPKPEPAPAAVQPEAWKRPKEGRKATKARVDAIRARLADHDDNERTWMRQMMDEARACGRDIVPEGQHTDRSIAICTALLALAAHHDDPNFVRLLLAAALDSDGAEHPTVSIGMSLGTLTLEQAERLTQALATSDIPITFADDGRARLVLDTAA
jgi:hypothetical protein